MAESTREGLGSWQNVELRYNDGTVLTVCLDNGTIRKLEAGDTALMEEIRRNSNNTNNTVPSDDPAATVERPEARSTLSDSSVPTQIRPTGSGSVPTQITPTGSGSVPTQIRPTGSGSVPTQITPTGSGSVPTQIAPTSSVPTQDQAASDDSDIEDSNSNQRSYMFWSTNSIKLLISLYREYEEQLEDPRKKKKDTWKLITKLMEKKGCQFTQNQIESKWRSLIQSHKDLRAANSKTGGKRRKTFQYHEEIEDIITKRHDVNPVVVVGSGCEPQLKKTFNTGKIQEEDHPDANNNNPSTSSNEDACLSQSKSAKQRRKRREKVSEMGQLLEFMREKEKKREGRANERNEILKQLLDVVKE